MKRILVTGALGQIGSELTPALRARYGAESVVACDLRVPPSGTVSGPFESADCSDAVALGALVDRYRVDTIFHLAAMLSAVAEQEPLRAWRVNMDCLLAALEVARERRCAIFTPSSIGAFGPETPHQGTPQDTLQRPTTMYGITKVAGELLCDYYHRRFGVDARGVRYPGIISNVTLPGGGTTDYAVAIFYEAVRQGRFTSYLKRGTYLDMMYMPDAIRAAIDLMEAPADRLLHRNAFNVTAMSFAPEQLADEIRKHIPTFQLDVEVDPVRQAIADSWPDRMDDSAARREWGWQPEYDLPRMTADMLRVLGERHRQGCL